VTGILLSTILMAKALHLLILILMNYLHDFDQLRNLSIGVVDYVSPVEIRVSLEPDAPQNTALNTGVPCLFPRINGFVLIPNEVGALVGVINWIGTEHSAYPKRKGFRDYDLIDLPFPSRKMMINPIGTLKTRIKEGESFYKLERGVYSFPSVGDSVIIPKDEQLKSIVENSDEGAFVKIGTAPIAGNASVKINPDKLFGRHVAVLGNTGSGKSCTAAGIIRWSLEEAHEHKKNAEKPLNCRFIILDPNGEYSSCFNDLDVDINRFKIELTDTETDTFKQLHVPAWFWNSYEWGSFSQATAKTQKPILRKALRELKHGFKEGESNDHLIILRFFQSCIISLRTDLNLGQISFGDKPGRGEFGRKLQVFADQANAFLGRGDAEIDKLLSELEAYLKQIIAKRQKSFIPAGSIEAVTYFEAFTVLDVEGSMNAISKLVSTFNFSEQELGLDEDVPKFYEVEKLPDHIKFLAENQGVLQFLDFLVMRIRSLLADNRTKATIASDKNITLESWLNEYLHGITIIDLSLIPTDVVHLIVAVISRVVFEAIQRYRRKNSEVLPTVLMLEEAHNFIKKTYHSNEELSTTEVCSLTFEKIAKEGRKFGLSLLISSQRPSELSDTVLSQCNTFLLHRIVNDRDQDLVRRLVPDNIGGLLKELPILPTQKAILLGWASPLPMLVQIKPLLKEHQPKSQDPDFWDVWIGTSKRDANWGEVVKDWQGNVDNDTTLTHNVSPNPNEEEEEDLLGF
jgi:DNA helicase HerA-like ATPase